MKQNCLYITQHNISDVMAENIKSYLDATKENPKKQVYKLIIDSCSIQDNQLAKILEGINLQGSYIKTFVNANNVLGHLSIKELHNMLPHLRELQVNNIST